MPLESLLFIAVFGTKMDQIRVKPQFLGAVRLCINVPNDSRRERNFFLQKCGSKQDFSVLRVWPLYSPPGTPRGQSWLILAIIYYRNSMISRKKGGVKILPAKMSVWFSHRVKRKIVPWFICPVWSSTFVKYPLCQVSKISNDHFCILAL